MVEFLCQEVKVLCIECFCYKILFVISAFICYHNKVRFTVLLRIFRVASVPSCSGLRVFPGTKDSQCENQGQSLDNVGKLVTLNEHLNLWHLFPHIS